MVAVCFSLLFLILQVYKIELTWHVNRLAPPAASRCSVCSNSDVVPDSAASTQLYVHFFILFYACAGERPRVCMCRWAVHAGDSRRGERAVRVCGRWTEQPRAAGGSRAYVRLHGHFSLMYGLCLYVRAISSLRVFPFISLAFQCCHPISVLCMPCNLY